MTDTAIADGMIAVLRERLPDDVERAGAAGAAGRQVERAHPVARHADAVGRNAAARAGRDRRERAPRRPAQAGARQFARRQRLGDRDRGARTARAPHGMLAVATHWRWFGLPDGMYDAVEAQARHPRRRHRDVADARVPPRPGAHGQGEELRVVGDRDGEGIQEHLTPPARHSFGWIAQDLNPDGAVGNAAIATAEKGKRAPPIHQVDGFIALLRDMANFPSGAAASAEGALAR